MPNKNTRSERQLVREAARDTGAREQLRCHLLPHVSQAVSEFIKARAIPADRQMELVHVAMQPFDIVFNIYLKNMHVLNSEEGHFYSYYIWWMRQKLTAYLEEENSSAAA